MEKQKQTIRKIAVIGGGSWATAIVKILSENNVKINWWLRSRKDIEHIKKYKNNPSYLSTVHIDTKKVSPSDDIKTVLKGADTVVLATPSAYILDILSQLKPADFIKKNVVSAVKGMIPDVDMSVTEYMEKVFEIKDENLLFIAGPCHAEEVAAEKLSYLTVCGSDPRKTENFAAVLRSRFVKATPLNDLRGAEFCAVMKNIIALACGLSHGLNYGDNFQAVLVSNALQEINTFLDTVAPLERDLDRSAYLGDLLVTAYSQYSRNRTFGNMIGRGYSVRSAKVEMNMVAEGYYAVNSIFKLMEKHQIDMPVTLAVYHILYERISPVVEFRILTEKFI